MKRSSKLLGSAITIYIITLVILAIYSYTQIDLNLTLSSNSLYQNIQQKLIFLGYFNRPLSTAIYIIILIMFFSAQIRFLYLAKKNILQIKTVWKLCFISCIFLLFAYPAFSHDIFNYIFDSRLVITHRVNPWEFTALDFPQDLWTRFMRWTHRTYPYGPFWLVLTAPFYFAGLGKFTLTLIWYKMIGALSYLASILFIKRITQKLSPGQTCTAMVFFGLSPLILIEGLVSAHLDIAMTAFLLAAIYFAISKKKKMTSWIMLFISIGIKFITAATLPIWFWWKGEEHKFKKAITAMLLLVLVVTVLVITKRELLPWYFITPLALAAIIPKRKELVYGSITLSVGLLLRYAPFLLQGEYNEWVRSTRNTLTIVPLIIILVWFLWKRKKKFFFSSS